LDDAAKAELLQRLQLYELDKSYSWMQEMLKQLLGWYTFFLTANIALIGYLTKADSRFALGPLPILMLFLDSCGVALIGVGWGYFQRADERDTHLIGILNDSAAAPADAAIRSVFPRRSLGIGFLFLAFGLVALAVVWGTLAWR
jgi:hypothetical protein